MLLLLLALLSVTAKAVPCVFQGVINCPVDCPRFCETYSTKAQVNATYYSSSNLGPNTDTCQTCTCGNTGYACGWATPVAPCAPGLTLAQCSAICVAICVSMGSTVNVINGYVASINGGGVLRVYVWRRGGHLRGLSVCVRERERERGRDQLRWWEWEDEDRSWRRRCRSVRVGMAGETWATATLLL